MDSNTTSRRPLADTTVQRLREGLSAGRIVVLPQILELIRAITARADSISVQQLADLIAQDPGVMARIIGIANRLGYNPAGIEITTIHQAIQIVGFERIRNLTVSIMLLENAESRLSPEEHREMASLALASGFLAQELLRSVGQLDAEVVFVCAALRNYGKLLLTAFLLEDYERACLRARDIGADAAFREVFGLTPLEIGRELLESEQLPESILSTLRDAPRKELQDEALSPNEQLVVASEGAVRVCELLEAPDLTPENFAARAVDTLRAHAPTLKVTGQQLADHVKWVALRCQDIAASNARVDSRTPFLQRLDALAEGQPLPPPGGLARRAQAPTPASADREQSAQVLQGALAELEELGTRIPSDPAAVFDRALAHLRAALHLTQSVVFLETADPSTCTARYGQGSLFEALRRGRVISRHHPDVFGLCLTRGEDILLAHPENPRMREFIPPWLLNVARDHWILLLALKDAQGTFGVLLGLSDDRPACALAESNRPLLSEFRNRLAPFGVASRLSPLPPLGSA